MSDSFDVSAFEKLADYLEQNPKAKAQVLATLGIQSRETEKPKPSDDGSRSTTGDRSTSDDLNAGKIKSKEDTIQDIVPKKPITSSLAILDFIPDFVIPRHISDDDNAYVVNLNGMYSTLHEMNSLIAQKFRASRAHQAFEPHSYIYYITFCANLQVARCLNYAEQLKDMKDISALDTFLKRYGPEKFDIPGPLMPYFKAITTYKVQNALHARVSPRFPNYYLGGNTTHTWNQSDCNQLFPYLPQVLAIAKKQLEHISSTGKAIPHAKDGSSSVSGPGTASLQWKDVSKNADTDLVKAITDHLGLGVDIAEKAANAWTKEDVNVIINPAYYKTPLYTDDLAKKAQPYVKQIKLPSSVFDGKESSLAKYLGIEQPTWLKTYLKYSSEYASLWTGSGTLADCSPDGPATGAYVSQYHDLPTGHKCITIPQPIKGSTYLSYFDNDMALELSSRVYTTQGSPEPVVERLSSVTQIHGKLPTNHWAHSTSVNTRRFGNVWSILPLYGPSSDVYFYDGNDEYVERMMTDKMKM